MLRCISETNLVIQFVEFSSYSPDETERVDFIEGVHDLTERKLRL